MLGSWLKPVNSPERLDLLQRCGRKRRLPLKSMKNDAFDEIAERYLKLVGERLKSLNKRLSIRTPVWVRTISFMLPM